MDKILMKEDSYVYTKQFESPDAKMLVVDDNEINRMVFSFLLKETRVQIREASSGFECLEMIQEEKFEVIFMDHMMPGMDGFEDVLVKPVNPYILEKKLMNILKTHLVPVNDVAA